MQQNLVKTFEWKQKYSTLVACPEELNRTCWGKGFNRSKCGHEKPNQLKYYHLHECATCNRQVLLTVGTVFEHTCLSLHKWLATLYWIGAGKSGISVQCLYKMIGVFWPVVVRMLGNILTNSCFASIDDFRCFSCRTDSFK